MAEILGHADTRMIDRIYGHLFESDRVRERVSRRAREAEGEGHRLPRLPRTG